MFGNIASKIALRKAGLNRISLPTFPKAENGASSTVAPNFDGLVTSLNSALPKSWGTWSAPPAPMNAVKPVPDVGTPARSTTGLRFPMAGGTPVILMFLRHCGCPFAEKSFIQLREIAEKHPDVLCIAVSHCPRKATKEWIDVIGGIGRITLMVDEQRDLYSLWGLGVSNSWYYLNPKTQFESAKGPWGRQMSGSRWQTGGTWGIDIDGIIVWGGPSKTADEIPALERCIRFIM